MRLRRTKAPLACGWRGFGQRARSANGVVRVGVDRVGGLGAAAEVNSLVGAANVLHSVIEQPKQAVELRLLLLLLLGLRHGLRDVDFVFAGAAVAALVGTEFDDGGIGFGQLAVQRGLVLRCDERTGAVAIGGNVFAEFVTAFHDGAVNTGQVLRQNHGHGVVGFFDAIDAGGQRSGDVVELRDDASGLRGLAGFHGCGAHGHGFVNAADCRHKRHVGLVLFGAVAFKAVALAVAIVPAVVPVAVCHCQEHAFGDFCHFDLSRYAAKSRCIHWALCARSKPYDRGMSYDWVFHRISKINMHTHALTPRQLAVFEAVCRGASNKQIARELHIAEPTVKLHLTGIFRALGVTTRTQAVLLSAGGRGCQPLRAPEPMPKQAILEEFAEVVLTTQTASMADRVVAFGRAIEKRSQAMQGEST